MKKKKSKIDEVAALEKRKYREERKACHVVKILFVFANTSPLKIADTTSSCSGFRPGIPSSLHTALGYFSIALALPTWNK